MIDQSLSDSAERTEGDASPREARGLLYPFGHWTPAPAEAKQVADGVFWIRMPLPFSLDHINLYVLEDGEGWALVDTGVRMPPIKALWEQLFAGPLAGRPVTRVIVTHYHPDHIGLAGWLCRQWGVPLYITRTEFLMAKMLMLDSAPEPPEEVLNVYRRAGWPGEDIEVMRSKGWGNFARGVSKLPVGYHRLQEGIDLTIGGRSWRIVIGRGHAPEHACLICDEAKIMISGDQVLPRITSNVSVYPTEPHANPLGDWMESIDKLRGLDDALFVLPAHNEPFVGLHARLDQLREDHLAKLERLWSHCQQPRRVVDCFSSLFRKRIEVGDIMMATGEALAHLHYLEYSSRLMRSSDGNVDWFVAA